MSQPPECTVQAVFFDVGNTLLHVHPSVGELYASVAKRHGAQLEPGRLQEQFDAAWEKMTSGVPRGVNRYRRHPGGEIGWWQDVVQQTFEGTGFDPGEHFQDFFDTFSAAGAWRAYPDTHEALADLRQRGVMLGVISNWDSRLPMLLEATGLRRYFSLIVCSSAEDIEKPAMEIFRRAARRCGLGVAQALHVGDRLLEDYQGATRAGLQALLVDRDGGASHDGARVVTDLTHVSRYL
ncbi:MAG: HAD-IA family hydrolase [Acidobacteriota bacterium]